MPPQLPKYLTLSSISVASQTDRGVIERMMARGLLAADALLRHGPHWVPLFLENRSTEILILRSEIVNNSPNGSLPANRRVSAMPLLVSVRPESSSRSIIAQ